MRAQGRRGASRLHEAPRAVGITLGENANTEAWARTATSTCARTSTTKDRRRGFPGRDRTARPIRSPTGQRGGERHPAAAHATNGALNVRAYKNSGEEGRAPARRARRGRGRSADHSQGASGAAAPAPTAPVWSGLVTDGRAYAAFTYNEEKQVPWRTLTGRQQFYLDHPSTSVPASTCRPTRRKPFLDQYGDL